MQHWVEEVKLSNGAEGLLIDAPSTNVTYIDISFRAGYYLSPEGKMDTAHVMEHLALGANQVYKKSSQFSQEFTKHGAYNNAYTGDYHMGYIAECAEFETERILDLMCIAIESPLFKEQDFKSEIANVREELKMRKNYHDTELLLELEDSLGFVSKSYGARTKQLSKITLEDIKNHYAKTHYSKNMRFIIAGPLARHKNAIIKRLEDIKLPSGGGTDKDQDRIELPNETPRQIEQPLNIELNGIDNVYYRWMSVFDGLLSRREKYALYAVQDYLFSTFHSKVFGKAREKGLVYGIDSSYYRTRDNHVWAVAGQVQAKNALPLFELITKQLTEIHKGKVSTNELNWVKDFQWGSFQKAIQTVSALADWYQYAYLVGGLVKEYPAVEELIYSVKVSDMKNIVDKLADSTAWGLGIMQNKKAKTAVADIEGRLSKFYELAK
jgi:predicted Zn-dependent peptidase